MDSSRNDPTQQQILAGTPAPLTLAFDAEAKKHFDTFEALFFQQGDQTGQPGTDDTYYERDSRIKRWLPYRTLMGISIASTTVAVAACIALWQSRGPAPTPPASTRAASVTSTAASVVAPVVPSPEPIAPVVATAAPAIPAPAVPSTPAPEPVAPAVAPAVPVEEKPTPTAAAPAVVAAETVAAAQPAPEPPAVAEAPAADDDAREPCRAALRGHKAKDIVATCSTAFDADATFAEAAVAVAKVELDRGRFTQAYAWSKKALAADPASADAYVYAGGAEQSRGHAKAAKEAYLQYLRLAPSGRYAAEIRAIVKSL